MNKEKEIPVLVLGYEFLNMVFKQSKDFPKDIRYSVSTKLQNITLEILCDIITAKYSLLEKKLEYLNKINLNLEKMRILIRFCYENTYLKSNEKYYKLNEYILNIGRQIGAWKKKVKEQLEDEKSRKYI